MRRLAGLVAALVLSAGGAGAQELVHRYGREGATEIVFRTSTDDVILGPAIAEFVAENPDLAVRFEQWGSNLLYARARGECDDGTPTADAILTSGVHQAVELVNEACAAPYRSEATAALPEARRWRDEAWGVTREPAVIAVNARLVPPADVPRTRFDLLDLMRRPDGAYQGEVATYDIEASGLGFLFAFEDGAEASTFGALSEAFARSGAEATCCSAAIIRGVAEGRWKIAYNVLGSYVAAAGYPDVVAVRPEDYTLYLSRAFLMPRGAAHLRGAERLLDYLLSQQGQAALVAAGLIDTGDQGAAGEGLARTIPIDPVLLLAQDRMTRAAFIRRWRDTFGP